MERCILALAMTNGMEIKAFRVQNSYDNTEFGGGGTNVGTFAVVEGASRTA